MSDIRGILWSGTDVVTVFSFCYHCVNGCMCPPFHRTVNWPSVPAATLFPRAPKSPPTRATKLSGGLVPGPRFVVLSHLHTMCPFVGFHHLNLSALHNSAVLAVAKGHGCAM